MAKQNVIYKEPKGYFNAEMLKAAKEYDAKQAAQKKAAKKNK